MPKNSRQSVLLQRMEQKHRLFEKSKEKLFEKKRLKTFKFQFLEAVERFSEADSRPRKAPVMQNW